VTTEDIQAAVDRAALERGTDFPLVSIRSQVVDAGTPAVRRR
jgi:hypothetical protein